MENRLGRKREEMGDRWAYRFENGLVVHTDTFLKADDARVLPIGGPQDWVLNHLVYHPEKVRGRRVFEPFAGSGVLGLMALQLGAAHVDFLDVNPRAIAFEHENAERNGFAHERWATYLESIDAFEPEAPYDLVLANPPFVPTPAGIAGTLTSAAGPEGCDLAERLFDRLDRLLAPEGEALVVLLQLVSAEGPLIAAAFDDRLGERTASITSAQVEAIPLARCADAYRRCFPDRVQAVDTWERDLLDRHGPLGLEHMVVHVHARRADEPRWSRSDDLLAKYGIEPYPASTNDEIALARVLENVVPAAP